MTAEPSSAALVCSGVVKRYGAQVAVDGVDLTVKRGALLALLGPSGCGKTTMLRLIAGLTPPSAGTIVVDGVTVASDTVSVAPEKRGVGMVFQDYALFPHLTVEKNVLYGLHAFSRTARRERAQEVLDLVGLGPYANRLPGALSGGQQQRVALARALAPSPKLILLDEPFSSLDAALRASVREEVRAILRAANQTAVFVTHDQEEALSLADEIAVMNHGQIHQVAAPHLLYTAPQTRFVAEFVGEANVLTGIRAGTYLVDTTLGRLPTMTAVPETNVTVVLRPESVRLMPAGDGDALVSAISYFGFDQLTEVTLPDGAKVKARHSPRADIARADRVRLQVDGSVLAF
ncbi:MAG: ABC transporter ATP-binding protein [Nitriliruptoraceae bacterium]